LDGNVSDLIEIIFWHLPEEIEENHGKKSVRIARVWNEVRP
jgi:hypothetical protein